MNKKVLITGASGYLANSLLPCVSRHADVVGVARNGASISSDVIAVSADLAIRAEIIDAVMTHKPDAIIHCAACNPGGSEEDMVAINDLGTKHIAEAAAQHGCRLVSVSSDTVLDGTAAPYADNATASPLPQNTYAVTKARGEAHIAAIMPSAISVRTSLIYGTDSIDRGTAGFAQRLRSGTKLSLFTDVIRQPVFDKALSEGLCTLALILVNESGVLNLAGDEAMSRYDFGIRMLDYWGIDHAGLVEASSGVGILGLPLDVSLKLDRAQALGMATPGLTDVLSG